MIITPGTFEESEISVDIVEDYTNGMLAASNPATQYMLNAALTAARHDMRWHVAPVSYGEVISLDGYGHNRLWLPTKKVVQIHSITSDGVSIDPVNDVVYSADVPNLVMLKSGVWSCQYSGIQVTWDHGFTNTAAVDWRNAILALVTNVAQISILGRSDAELASKQIADVTYQWAATHELGSVEQSLAKYRLLSRWV